MGVAEVREEEEEEEEGEEAAATTTGEGEKRGDGFSL